MAHERERIRNLLADSIGSLCQSGLTYNAEVRVEGLLGITLDSKDIFLVNINQVLAPGRPSDAPLLNTYPSETCSSDSASRRISRDGSEITILSRSTPIPEGTTSNIKRELAAQEGQAGGETVIRISNERSQQEQPAIRNESTDGIIIQSIKQERIDENESFVQGSDVSEKNRPVFSPESKWKIIQHARIHGPASAAMVFGISEELVETLYYDNVDFTAHTSGMFQSAMPSGSQRSHNSQNAIVYMDEAGQHFVNSEDFMSEELGQIRTLSDWSRTGESVEHSGASGMSVRKKSTSGKTPAMRKPSNPYMKEYGKSVVNQTRLGCNKFSEEFKQQVMEFRMTHTGVETERKFGVSCKTVSRWCRLANVPMHAAYPGSKSQNQGQIKKKTVLKDSKNDSMSSGPPMKKQELHTHNKMVPFDVRVQIVKYRRKHGITEAATTFNVSKTSVRRFCAQAGYRENNIQFQNLKPKKGYGLGVNKREKTEPKKDDTDAAELRKNVAAFRKEHTLKETTEKYGVSRNSVIKWCAQARSHQLTAGGVHVTPELKSKVVRFRKTHDVSETARAFRVSRSSVRRWYDKAMMNAAVAQNSGSDFKKDDDNEEADETKFTIEFKREVVNFRRTSSLKETAFKFGVDPSSIIRWCQQAKSNKLRASSRILTPELKARIVKFRRDHDTRTTARRFKVSKTSVTRWFEKAKKKRFVFTKSQNQGQKFSQSFRDEVIRFRETHTLGETMERFNISASSVMRWMKQAGKDGDQSFSEKQTDEEEMKDPFVQLNRLMEGEIKLEKNADDSYTVVQAGPSGIPPKSMILDQLGKQPFIQLERLNVIEGKSHRNRTDVNELMDGHLSEMNSGLVSGSDPSTHLEDPTDNPLFALDPELVGGNGTSILVQNDPIDSTNVISSTNQINDEFIDLSDDL